MTNGEPNKPLEPKVLWYIISFIIPILGIILGIVYLRKPEPEVKSFGKTCLILGIIPLALWCICFIIMMVTGGIASLTS